MHILRILVVCASMISFAVASDWTEFRGPTQQGHAPDEAKLPLQWNATENVRWKTELPGEGWSSPVVSDGTIYISAAVPQGDDGGYTLQLILIDAATGKVRHSVDAFTEDGQASPKIHAKNSHASPTPLIEGDFVYVHFGHQGIACFRRDGTLVWRNNSFSYPPVHGNGGSPTLAGDKLVFSCDGEKDPFILALDKATGEVAWRYDRPSDAEKKFSFSTPLVINAAGRDQLISPGSNLVVSLDPQTGQEIWRVHYDGFSVVARPVFAHDLIYISTSFMTPVTYAIRADGQGDVTDTHVVWTEKRGAPNTPSMLVVDEWLYMVSDRGVASCLDAKSGEIKWQERLGGGYSASPLYSAGRIYFQSEEGEAVVVAAQPEFREIARNDLGERTLASYGVIDNDLLIRTDKHLFRIEATP